MKEGWTYKRLGDLCRIRTGKLDANAADDDGLYPFFTCSVTPLRINKYAYDCECVLVAGNGDLNVKYYSGKFNAYQRTYIIESNDKNVLDVRYLYMFLSEYVTILRKKSMGAIIKYIKLGYLTEAKLLLPPISEQQSIFEYLDSAFAKIDALKANAEKALNEAKALFQASLKEMLEPKEGWEEKKLGEVGTFIRGGNFSKKDFVEGGFPCIHYGQIHTKLGVATYKHLSCVPASMVKKDRCASRGDLVIAVTSEDDEGSCKCTAWMADYDAYVGGHAAILKHSLNPIFVSYYFKAARFQKAKLEYTHGFKVVEISPKDIAKIPIAYPSPSKQQSIVDTLDSLKSKVDRLQANYEKISQECDALKQAILRQVFE